MTSFESMSRAVWVAPALLLVIAISDWPDGYYTFMRIVVSGVCGLLAYSEYLQARSINLWMVSLALLGILFNPIIPISLEQDDWQVLDAFGAILLLAHLFHARRSSQGAASGRLVSRVKKFWLKHWLMIGGLSVAVGLIALAGVLWGPSGMGRVAAGAFLAVLVRWLFQLTDTVIAPTSNAGALPHERGDIIEIAHALMTELNSAREVRRVEIAREVAGALKVVMPSWVVSGEMGDPNLSLADYNALRKGAKLASSQVTALQTREPGQTRASAFAVAAVICNGKAGVYSPNSMEMRSYKEWLPLAVAAQELGLQPQQIAKAVANGAMARAG